MNITWTSVEKQYVKDNTHIKDKDLAQKMEQLFKKRFTLYGLRRQRLRLGIKKASGRGISQVIKDIPICQY